MNEETDGYDNSHGESNSHASSGDELARFGQRMTEVVGTATVRAFARTAEVDQKSMRAYMDGQTEPSRAALVRLAKAGNVSVEWLATGQGEKSRAGAARAAMEAMMNGKARKDSSELVQIPLYSVSAAAGSGLAIMDEKIIGTRAFNREWIETRLRMRMEDLALLTVGGNSMQPTLNDGDLLMLNVRETRLSREDIYVIRQGDDLMVKRLQHIPAIGGFRMISDNQAYPTVDIYPAQAAENRIEIVGRAVWWAHVNTF